MDDDNMGDDGGPDLEWECQMFVAASSGERLVERLAAVLGVPHGVVGAGAQPALTYGCVEVEWDNNGYEGTGGGDDFLDWHSLLVCQPRAGASRDEVVADMATILRGVREAGYRAVPSCTYEELLPLP
ncbi:hypothetical protein [Streptomyces sp. NPDC090025]|uniref:hypothetical protein n=1 Tax=Streptomyces sp. NPDC090025 TaxID=3365922 RepID=UPI003838701E